MLFFLHDPFNCTAHDSYYCKIAFPFFVLFLAESTCLGSYESLVKINLYILVHRLEKCFSYPSAIHTVYTVQHAPKKRRLLFVYKVRLATKSVYVQAWGGGAKNR